MWKSAPIALLALLAACMEPSPETAAATQTPIAVTTIDVATENWPLLYEATGTVRAGASAVIASKWMGYVSVVEVRTGDRVRAGQLLVSLDARDLDAGSRRAEAARDEVRESIPEADSAVAAAKAGLDLDQATWRRMKELYDKKSISDHEFDEVSAKLKASQAAYDMACAGRRRLDAKLAEAGEEVSAAEISRGYARITAPFSGVVTAKSVDPGSLATPGAPLLTIEREGTYRLEASIEESKAGAIHPGQPATVTLDGIAQPIQSRVSEIVPAVDAASRSYIVKIDLPAGANIRSGLFGRAAFALGSRSVTAIPTAAVTERGQLQSVMVADNGVARTRLIATGDRAKDRVEVLSGLNPGERIIFPVPSGLADGARVETAR